MMPNSRRRRFSVQQGIAGQNSVKMQSSSQSSQSDLNSSKTKINSVISMKSSKSKQIASNNSNVEIVAERELVTKATNCKTTVDKDVTASSSTIDLFNILSMETADQSPDETSDKGPSKLRDARQPLRRDKYPRQHRVKVRSPKRRPPVLNHKSTEFSVRSIGSGAIDWEQELEVFVDQSNIEEQHNRLSNHSLDDMCRICHGGESLSSELGQLISACSCRGTVGRVHVKCLERWLTESGKSRCELCGTRYATRRVHRYGIPKALLMWVLSQNAKQLMVDSLGIMLMSPLAVLAAWLSGRTLAGLMTQDKHATPWPLASTFVLACMTLVCYYCWIVSAATRHALGWWIWYRSQYEVRLQLENSEEQTLD